MQVDSMDIDLRNGLWDVLIIFYWNQVKDKWISYYKKMDILFKMLRHSYFKKPIDILRDYRHETYNERREYFFNCEWYEVYDFMEFMANNCPDKYNEVNPKLMVFCNSVI